MGDIAPTLEADEILTERDRVELANLYDAWREAKRRGLHALTFGLWAPASDLTEFSGNEIKTGKNASPASEAHRDLRP